MPLADIAISTHKQRGIHRLATPGTLPHIPGITYVISWQNHDNAPIPRELAARSDVRIYRFDGQGQSHNRNNALRHCAADIVIISDDDLTYYPEEIEKLIRTFKENPDMDVATFRSVHDPAIRYPEAITSLSLPLPKGYYVSCFEIAFRRNEHTADLQFHPEFGLNSPHMHGGEDEIFLLTAIRRGLDCRFIPVTLCAHPDLSTGLKQGLSPANLQAMGCVIALHYNHTPSLAITIPARLLLKALRLSKSGRLAPTHHCVPILRTLYPLLHALYHLTRGALRAPRLNIFTLNP